MVHIFTVDLYYLLKKTFFYWKHFVQVLNIKKKKTSSQCCMSCKGFSLSTLSSQPGHRDWEMHEGQLNTAGSSPHAIHVTSWSGITCEFTRAENNSGLQFSQVTSLDEVLFCHCDNMDEVSTSVDMSVHNSSHSSRILVNCPGMMKFGMLKIEAANNNYDHC